MVCMFMIILSESLLTIRRFLCSSLRLTIYAGSIAETPENTFAGTLKLDAYSRGMGGMESRGIFPVNQDR